MTDLRAFVSDTLKGSGLKLNTDLGQHFLIDQDVLDAILDAADVQPDDHIVEIGPGIGVLTRELVRRAAKVTAIEIDERFLPLVRLSGVVQGHRATLDVIHGNALTVPFPNTPYRIVANIPYHITSPLLRHAYRESALSPTSMTLLIQRDVAEKITDDHDRGLLTILVGLFGTPVLVETVPPEAFLPPPKVESAILHIASHEKPLASPEIIDRVFMLAKHAFAGKRKMLRNTIGALPDGSALLEKSGIAADRRPQTLTVDEWLKLASA